MEPLYNIFIDLETGGLDPIHNGITEISAVPFVIGSSSEGRPYIQPMQDTFSVIVQPECWLTYSVGALAMQNRTLDELTQKGIPEEKAYEQLFDHIESYLGSGSWVGRIWAHEATFDWSFLRAMEDRMVKDPHLHYFGKRCDWSCSKFLYRRLAALGVVPDMQEVHLNTVAKYYGIPFEVQHTSMGDCYVGLQCLARIMQDEYDYYMQKVLALIAGRKAHWHNIYDAHKCTGSNMFVVAQHVEGELQALQTTFTHKEG